MQVARWMTSPVITVLPDCPATIAFQRMMENQIRRLVVVDEDDEVIGIVTDRDLRAVVFAGLAPNSLPPREPARGTRRAGDDYTVADLMSKEVVAVDPQTDVREAALLMHNHKFGGLPVLEGRKAVGMITVQDLMEILVAQLSSGQKGAAG
jgi:acetoin utilization protein AcuB